MTGRKARLTQRTVEAVKPEARRFFVGDTDIPGFRLHVLPSGKKGFFLAYRVGGGRGATQREPKIGDWPAMTTEKARKIAADWFADVRDGNDPAARRKVGREAPRMNALFNRYISDHARPHKKRSSVANDERLIKNRLRPAFGAKKVAEVTRANIDAFHKALASKPYEANRALALLSKAFNLAELWDMRPEGSNPCRHVRKYAEKKRKRFLSTKELAALGEALRVAERDGSVTLTATPGVRNEPQAVVTSPAAIAAIRLLMFTGARKGEILGLQWSWIDNEVGRIHLPDSKTGEKTIPLSPPALEVLDGIRRVDGNPHVIVGGKVGAHLVNLKDPWAAIRAAAGLDDVRIHDLRHSFASVGAAGGMSLPIIGALLGHSQAATTQRYAHLSDDPLQAATAQIGERIKAAMGDSTDGGEVMPLRGM